MSCAAIILAAGAASRWGRPKQLVRLSGETLLDRAARTALAAGCDPVVCVIGAHADALALHPMPAGVTPVFHEQWAEGMGSSLAFGVKAVMESAPATESLFVLLCDQPMVTPNLLAVMQAAGLERGGKGIVLCDPGEGPPGPPALFSRAFFTDMQALTGDIGARALARRHAEDVATVVFPAARWDLDTPEDYDRLLAQYTELTTTQDLLCPSPV